MLYIDDVSAGEHRQAFHSAAQRFWQMHQSEKIYVWANGMAPGGLRMGIRAHEDKRPRSLVVLIGDDPEEDILTALDEWWADRMEFTR